MKASYLFIGFLILSLSIEANSKVMDHHPRGRQNGHRHPVKTRNTVVVVRPPARVIVPPRPVVVIAPPPPVVVVSTPPRYVRVEREYSAPRPIPAREAIRNAKNMMDNQKFEADRLRIAKDAAEDLPLKTVDILDMLQMFSFESSKLDFAKFAYSRIVDPQNYSIVFEAFKYTSSIKNLEDYMYEGR